MPHQCKKTRGVTACPPYLRNNAEAFSSTKTEDSNILDEDDGGYGYILIAVMLLDLSPMPAEQGAEEIFFESNTETYLLPLDRLEKQRESTVKSEGDGGVVEEAFTQPENREEMMLVHPIAVYSRPENRQGVPSAEDMGYQVLGFECSFPLDLTCMLRIETLNAPSQSYHGPSASCGASKAEEELWVELVEDNEDHFVYNRDFPNNGYAERCVS